MLLGESTSLIFRKIFFPFLDIVCLYFVGIIVYKIRFGDYLLSANYQLLLVFMCIIAFIILRWFSAYGEWRGQSFLNEASKVISAFITISLALTLAFFLLQAGASFSRLWVMWSLIGSCIAILTYRFIIRFYLRKIRLSGNNLKHVVVVGAGTLGKRTVDTMKNKTWAGYKPVAFFDDDQSIQGLTHNKTPIAGSLDDVASFIETYRKSNNKNSNVIDQVWIALPMKAQQRIEELQEQLRDSATNVYFIPDLFGFNLANYHIEEKIGLPIMNMSASPMQGIKAVIKRLEDVVISSIGLILIAPILAVIAILIKLDSKGPVFFKQRRYGVDGKEITVWKFRSMTVTENGEKVTQAKRGDSRVTKIGAFLRKSSLDELPQLINVLQGAMSLVGPRPHAVAHNEYYRKEIQGYMERHKMRPGITGWAQVNGSRGETSEISQMEERVRYDLEYIRNWSLGLDIRILFKTVSTVLNTKDTY